MLRDFDRFIDSPNGANFLKVRQQAIKQPTFRSLELECATIERLLDFGDFQQVARFLDDLQPGCLLSPRLHVIQAELADQQGNPGDHETERFLFRLCLEGILATGDGSSNAPFQVTHTTDVRDVLNALDVQVSRQFYMERDGRLFDVVQTERAGDYWFDFSHLGRRKLVPTRRDLPIGVQS